jgi:hypothetical protein
MAEPQLLPPLQLDNGAISQIADQVANLSRHDNHRPFARVPARQPCNCPQRRPMQVIEMRV